MSFPIVLLDCFLAAYFSSFLSSVSCFNFRVAANWEASAVGVVLTLPFLSRCHGAFGVE
jgi:hypothetical protein